MATLDTYRTYIQKVLSDYAGEGRNLDGIERQLTFDTQRDHYHLFNVGWRNKRRFHGCVLHVDLKDGKIWIQHNGTEVDIPQKFLDLGVPKQDIVLGMHDPFTRQFTGFALG